MKNIITAISLIILTSCSSIMDADSPTPLNSFTIQLARMSGTKGNPLFNAAPQSTFLAKLDNANLAVGVVSLIGGFFPSNRDSAPKGHSYEEPKYTDPVKYVEAMAAEDFKKRGQDYIFTENIKIVSIDKKHSILVFNGFVSDQATKVEKKMVCAMLFEKSKPKPRYVGKHMVWEGTDEINEFESLSDEQLASTIVGK